MTRREILIYEKSKTLQQELADLIVAAVDSLP